MALLNSSFVVNGVYSTTARFLWRSYVVYMASMMVLRDSHVDCAGYVHFLFKFQFRRNKCVVAIYTSILILYHFVNKDNVWF